MAAAAPDCPLSRIVAVDYSGDKGPGQRQKIWAGVWTRGQRGAATVTLEAGRTRAELAVWLLELARETPRMVVGIDCCFSYPAWFVRECGAGTIFEFWAYIARHAEQWLTAPADLRDPRFWGRPHKRPAEFSGANLHRMMRRTDMENKIEQALEGGDPVRAALMAGVQAKSPFQIGGAGAVGTASLRGIPWLAHLHTHGFRVWPFESAALAQPQPAPLLVEIYTRLLTGPVKKANAVARRDYLALRRLHGEPLYRKLSQEIIARAENSEDAFDALVCCLEMVRLQPEFALLRATEDPQARLEGITWRSGVVTAPAG